MSIETHYLGRKGSLNELRKAIGTLPKEERPAFGARINEAVDAVTALIDAQRRAASRGTANSKRACKRRRIDVTLPGRLCRRDACIR